jgi:DNA-binding transcriptional MerR regulator
MMGLADGITVQGTYRGYRGPPDSEVGGGGQHPPHWPWHPCLMLSSHDRQSTTSSAPEVNTPDGLLAIGELARRTGVTASALRYYEELGLLPPPVRVSGQRRYPESAARVVGMILVYSDAGFTLAEQKTLLAAGASPPGDRRQLMRRKLADLDEQIAKAQAARDAISHGLRCPHDDITQCPNFNSGVTARLDGQLLSESHQRLHAGRHA